MRALWIVVAVVLAGGSLPAYSANEPTLPPKNGFVVVCPVSGMIDDGVAVLVERAVRESEGAKALILEIDTPGGLVDSAIKISKSIDSAPCPTLAYIKGMGAISAGALISYSCKSMAMAPDTNIGAATPVNMTADGMLPTGEKEVSFMRAKMRALAEHNGYNPAIAEAMVDKDIELRARTRPDGSVEIFSVYRPSSSGLVDLAKSLVKGAPDNPVDILKKVLEPEMPLPKIPLPDGSTPSAPAVPETKTPNKEDSKSASDETDPQLAGTEILLPAGKLLTLTPSEAIRYGLIRDTVLSLPQVMGVQGYGDDAIRWIEPTWSEGLFRWLTNPLVAGLLLMFGVGGLYLEMKTPGASLPAIVGVVCLALFFGAHYLIGAAEWIDIFLVVLGMVLILVEIFLIPGFGFIGVAGILALMAGIYLSLTNVFIPQYSWDYARLGNAGVTVTVAAAAFAGFVYLTWRYLPHTPVYRAIVQSHEQRSEHGYTVQTAEEERAAIGLRGVALSMLRPAGRGRFGNQTYSVVTRGDFIDAGAPVMIVQVDGNRYVVERTDENA